MEEHFHKLSVTALVVLPFLGVLLAVVLLWNQYVFWQDLVLLLVLYVLAASGIGIGYHRMLTHQGFKTFWPIKLFVLLCGLMAFEGRPDAWTATHIKHHAHSDDEEDPHSPLEGFWHAHIGWLFSSANFPEVQEYAPHLLQDRMVMFLSRTALLWMGLSLLLPYVIGGWTAFLWAGVVRVFLTTHVTWSVNSICHTFGHRAFETTDQSRNNWLIGLLGLGEGWHNNHHAFPTNAFHGMRWWQFDFNGLVIRGLERVGLVWNVQRVTLETEEAHRTRAETMKETLRDLRTAVGQAVHTAREELQETYQKLRDQLPKPQWKEARRVQKHADRQLREIQRMLSSASLIRKHRLEQRGEDVKRILHDAKEALKRKFSL